MDTISTTEGAVLGLTAFGQRSAYDLAQLAERSIAYLWTPSRSQIYKTLPRLLERGLVRAREVEQQGRPDKSLYRITPRGRTALRRWLDEVDDEPADGRVVFPLKLFFCDFASPRTAQAQLGAYRRFLERRLAQYEATRSDDTWPERVRAHGIARARATLAWIDDVSGATRS
jgi:PadR family transcriptional regulator AphA